MASGLTNIGKIRMLEMAFRNTQDTAAPSTAPFYIALSNSAASLSAATTTYDTATQIVVGNGYSEGGLIINRDTTDFDVLSIDTASNYGQIQFKDITWTASGGNLPASGDGAYYAVITDDNATIGSRQVYGWIDLSEARSIGNGAQLTLQNISIRIT